MCNKDTVKHIVVCETTFTEKGQKIFVCGVNWASLCFVQLQSTHLAHQT